MQKLPYWLIFIISVAVIIIRFINLDKGFFSFYDEAYFLLKAREVTDGIITGKSQWNFLAVHWFPFWDLSDAVFSRAAGNILAILAAIVATISSAISFKRNYWFKYLSVSLLVFFSIGGQICYVNMQAFLLCVALSAFLIYAKIEKEAVKRAMLVIAGFAGGLSLFVIMPGGALTLLCFAIVVILLNRGNLRNGFLQLAFGVIGVAISLAYLHFFICNLKDVLDAMSFTATYFTKSGYHYDPLSFVTAIGLFLRDCIFIFVFYCGAYYIAGKFNFPKFKWISGVIYLALIFVYTYYQKKPVISSAMFFSSLVVIPFVFDNLGKLSLKDVFSEMGVINAFLFCFPLIASMGTNTALSGRIGCFIISWCFIWFGVESSEESVKPKWYVTFAALLIILLPAVKGAVSTLRDTENCVHFEKGNPDFAKLYINERQKDYFDNVYDLMKEYGYKENGSVVFTAQFDYATILAFNAKLSSNFHQINNFLYWDKSQMIKPDFIILSGWDETVIGEELAKTGWGWPEEFDAYVMGTPETTVLTSADIEQRTVYCRKYLLTSSH